MPKLKTSKTKFIILIIVWVLILLSSLSLLNFFIGRASFNVAFVSNMSFDLLYIIAIVLFLLSIPLTTLLAYGGKIDNDKDGFINAIVLNALLIFLVIAFYQLRLAIVGSGNLSLETIYNAKQMTAFEYNTFYTQTVNTFFDVATKKIIISGMVILSIATTIIKLVRKN